MLSVHDDAGGLHGPAPTYGELVAVNPTDVQPAFPIRRVYFLYQTEASAVRGKHAHRKLEQLIVCPKGSVRVMLDDGKKQTDFLLNKPTEGLTVGPGMWRELTDFAPGTVVVVFASQPYDERDYIRDYAAFLANAQKPHR